MKTTKTKRDSIEILSQKPISRAPIIARWMPEGSIINNEYLKKEFKV
jgi:hypothetical protein